VSTVARMLAPSAKVQYSAVQCSAVRTFCCGRHLWPTAKPRPSMYPHILFLHAHFPVYSPQKSPKEPEPVRHQRLPLPLPLAFPTEPRRSRRYRATPVALSPRANFPGHVPGAVPGVKIHLTLVLIRLHAARCTLHRRGSLHSSAALRVHCLCNLSYPLHTT
jgi:hypothetical protein